MGGEEGKKDGAVNEVKEEKKLKSQLKVVRILTVMVYLGAVTGGGTLLSLYYILFWDPQIKVDKPSGWRFRRDLENAETLAEPQRLALPTDQTPNYIDKNFAQRWTQDPEPIRSDSSRDPAHSDPEITPPIQNINLEGLKDGQFRVKRNLRDIENLEELPPQVFQYPRRLRESTIRKFLEHAHDNDEKE